MSITRKSKMNSYNKSQSEILPENTRGILNNCYKTVAWILSRFAILTSLFALNIICFVSACYLIVGMVESLPFMAVNALLFYMLAIFAFIIGLCITSWYIYNEIYKEKVLNEGQYFECVWQSLAYIMSTVFYPIALTALLFIVLCLVYLGQLLLGQTFRFIRYALISIHPFVLAFIALIILVIIRFYVSVEMMSWLVKRSPELASQIRFVVESMWIRLKHLHSYVYKGHEKQQSKSSVNVFSKETA